MQQLIEQTVAGLGYDVVEVEWLAGGVLRVTIDWPWSRHAPSLARFITVEDCEKVTRQLQFALDVDGVEYARLEVSSPGIDRLLRSEEDFERFVGEVVDITLKEPIGAAANSAEGGKVAANRKKFRGVLEMASTPAGEQPGRRWRIVWSNAPAPKPGQRVSGKRTPEPLLELGFALDELREARLAPVVDFKGRGRKKADVPLADKDSREY